jgi:DedD protein
MEEKNDLMKDLTQNDTNNLRKYLLIGGGVFVIFVIGIVVSKFLFSTPKKDDTAVILPPEIQQDKKDTNLFNNIPIENNQPIQPQKKEEFKKPQIQSQSPAPVENTQSIPQIDNSQQEQKLISQPAHQPKPIEKPQPQSQPQPQPKSQPIPKHQPKPTLKEKKVKVQKLNYYIQVTAVTRGEPNPKFLKLIKKNGFNYKIEEVTIKGKKIKRVLVGGFKTKQEALKALPKVKKSISSSAFIKRVK